METKTVMNQRHHPLSCPVIAADLFSNEAVGETCHALIAATD